MSVASSQLATFFSGLLAMPIDDKHIEARRHRHGPIETYEVFVEDFDRIEKEAQTIGSDFNFGSIWLTVAITCTATLTTIPHDWSIIFTCFLSATLVGYTLGAYFLFRWSRQRDTLEALMDRIRACQIPQWGEEGKELRLSEIDRMKPVVPPPTGKTEGDA
jgi:hypothetical protein